MEKIRLVTQQVSVHSASAASVMSRGVNTEVIHFLPENLAPLKHMTEKAEMLCKETESELNGWIEMMTELLEVSVETHSLSESQRKEAREAFSVVLSEIHEASREKTRLGEELQDFQRYIFKLLAKTIEIGLFCQVNYSKFSRELWMTLTNFKIQKIVNLS